VNDISENLKKIRSLKDRTVDALAGSKLPEGVKAILSKAVIDVADEAEAKLAGGAVLKLLNGVIKEVIPVKVKLHRTLYSKIKHKSMKLAGKEYCRAKRKDVLGIDGARRSVLRVIASTNSEISGEQPSSEL